MYLNQKLTNLANPIHVCINIIIYQLRETYKQCINGYYQPDHMPHTVFAHKSFHRQGIYVTQGIKSCDRKKAQYKRKNTDNIRDFKWVEIF